MHLRTQHGAERDTKVTGEAGKEEGKAGWMGMDPAPR